MKVIVFQGQSQYDVLRTYSSFYTQQLQEYGIEAVTCDMSIIDSKMYLKMIDKINPDFTIAYNPVVYMFDDNLLHFQKTKVPHIVRLGDNPYYHVYDRALKNPNDSYVFTVTPQTTYEYAFNKLGVKRYSILTHSPAQKHYKVSFKDKIYPTVFFGSYMDPDKILLNFKERYKSKQIIKVVDVFCSIIREQVESVKSLLSEPIEIYFENYLKNEYYLDQDQVISLTKEVFYIIDNYYRNLVRKVVLTSFANSGLEMLVFGREDTANLLNGYTNVKVYHPINYHEYINVIAHSKVSLNITPMFKSNHERIPTSLFNSTLLCTNIMDDLIRNYPGILESSIFYNLNNLKETAELLARLSNNEQEYNELVERGVKLAEENFTFEKDIDQIINIYKKQFN